MRKWFAAAAMAVALLAPAEASAQANIGLKFGAAFSHLQRGVATEEKGGLVGYSGQFVLQFGDNALGWQLGFASTQKGAKFDDPNNTADGKLKISYIEMPVTVVLKAKKGPYAYAGPSIAVESKCESETQEATGKVANGCNNQGTTVFERRKFDLSATAGVGFRQQVGRRSILLEAAYTYGFTNINKTSDTDFAKNRSLAVYVGFITKPIKKPK